MNQLHQQTNQKLPSYLSQQNQQYNLDQEDQFKKALDILNTHSNMGQKLQNVLHNLENFKNLKNNQSIIEDDQFLNYFYDQSSLINSIKTVQNQLRKIGHVVNNMKKRQYDKNLILQTQMKQKKTQEKQHIKDQLKNLQHQQLQQEEQKQQLQIDQDFTAKNINNNDYLHSTNDDDNDDNINQSQQSKTNKQNNKIINQFDNINNKYQTHKKLKTQQPNNNKQNNNLQEYSQPNNQSYYQTGELNKQKNCHTCKQNYTMTNNFYDQLCYPCGKLNFSKRFLTCDNLQGKIALVTGGRVKIGFEIALSLLRNNISKLIVTSRFPKDTFLRFSKQKDFDKWKNNLVIYGLDFRDIQGVLKFCDLLNQNLEKLDILINNAAQTNRRDPYFYQNLLQVENQNLQQISQNTQTNLEDLNNILPQNFHYNQQKKQQALQNFSTNNDPNDQLTIKQNNNNQIILKDTQVFKNVDYSVLQSQIPVLKSDFQDISDKQKTMPLNLYDTNQQQVDLSKTSWNNNIQDVNLMEFMETQMINQFAPFVFIQKLLPLMKRNNPEYKQYRFIQNVSSMEGKFNRFKNSSHPHTNMSKAALNMLTRTCGRQYSQFNIFMNSVDTGWVTEMNSNSQNIEKTVPLDEIDGAMRVLDNVYQVLNGQQQPEYSQFYKDYKKSDW